MCILHLRWCNDRLGRGSGPPDLNCGLGGGGDAGFFKISAWAVAEGGLGWCWQPNPVLLCATAKLSLPDSVFCVASSWWGKYFWCTTFTNRLFQSLQANYNLKQPVFFYMIKRIATSFSASRNFPSYSRFRFSCTLVFFKPSSTVLWCEQNLEQSLPRCKDTVTCQLWNNSAPGKCNSTIFAAAFQQQA